MPSAWRRSRKFYTCWHALISTQEIFWQQLTQFVQAHLRHSSFSRPDRGQISKTPSQIKTCPQDCIQTLKLNSLRQHRRIWASCSTRSFSILRQYFSWILRLRNLNQMRLKNLTSKNSKRNTTFWGYNWIWLRRSLRGYWSFAGPSQSLHRKRDRSLDSMKALPQICRPSKSKLCLLKKSGPWLWILGYGFPW